jgi:Leucine-rich repeat (LRR) protein
VIPQKVREIYKKEKEILSLIEENLNDKDILMIQKEPKNMERIKNMELADNKLTRVDFITAHFPNLDRLQLSRNAINNIDTISRLTKMVKLNLRDNHLVKLPD